MGHFRGGLRRDSRDWGRGCVCCGRWGPLLCVVGLLQKIRTIELDGKTIKLQIVRGSAFSSQLSSLWISSRRTHCEIEIAGVSFVGLTGKPVGHRRPGALPHDHLELLPRRARHHRRLRRDRPRELQQRQAVAARDRQVRVVPGVPARFLRVPCRIFAHSSFFAFCFALDTPRKM